MMFNKIDFLYLTQLDEDTLDLWLIEEWLLPRTDGNDVQFTETDIARAHLIHNLTSAMGVNPSGVGIILDLLDQMHSLRRAVGARLELEQNNHKIN